MDDKTNIIEWMNAINQAQNRPAPKHSELTEILREGSYLFYDFKDITETFETSSAQSYTKHRSPLYSSQIIDQNIYWNLLGIITEDIPFYFTEPNLELTVNETPMWPNGVNLAESLALETYRDPGTVNIPNALQGSEFWSSWFRDSLGYYKNKLILDVYNKLQFPFLNEHHFLNAGLFPSLAHASNITVQGQVLDFQTDVNKAVAEDIEDIGIPVYLTELVDAKLQSVYALLDYYPDSAEILSDWVDSLYQIGMIPAEDIEKEKSIYRLQDIRYELLKRKFAGTTTLYQLILRSINRSGSYVSTVPASVVGNSKAAYAVFNEQRNIRLVNLPGISSSPITISDLPFDPLYEFYTRPTEEGSGMEIPLDVLYPLFYSASSTYNLAYINQNTDPGSSEIYIANPGDSATDFSRSSYSYGTSNGMPLRSATDSLVWDALTGLTVSQSLSTVYTTLDEKIYEESEEGVNPNATLHLDPMTTRTTSGEIVEYLHTLDEQVPYASMSDVTGHALDISANSLLYHQNTFQKIQGENYEYLTYPITDNTSVSLMDSPWISYLKYTADQKSRVQEEVSAGVQISGYNQLGTAKIVEYPLFFLSPDIDSSGETPVWDSENFDYQTQNTWYLWFALIRYDAETLLLCPNSASEEGPEFQPRPKLMSKITLAGNLTESGVSDEARAQAAEYYSYNVGLLPLTYPDLTNGTISSFQYSAAQDDYTDQGYNKGYFVFSAWNNFPGKHLRSALTQADFLDKDPEINTNKTFANGLNIRLADKSQQEYIQTRPDSETKTVYFILKKQSLTWQQLATQYGADSEEASSVPQYLYTWSDPIPVFKYKDIQQVYTRDPETEVTFYPDWWSLVYYLNPYLNFVADSASPLQHKKVLASYTNTKSSITEGPSSAAALSNLTRMRHMGISCNDNGLPTIYNLDNNSVSLNNKLELNISNPEVRAIAQPTDADLINTGLLGVYLDHGYRSSKDPTDPAIRWNSQDVPEIEAYTLFEKQQVQESVVIHGDNRNLHPLDTPTSIDYTEVYQSSEKIPCIEFSIPKNIPATARKAQLNEFLTLRPYNYKDYFAAKDSENRKWVWTPNANNPYPVVISKKGSTICLNVQFDFSYDENQDYLGPDIYKPSADSDTIYTSLLADRAEHLSLAAFDQVLLEQPGCFKLWYIGTQKVTPDIPDSSVDWTYAEINDKFRTEHAGCLCLEYKDPDPDSDFQSVQFYRIITPTPISDTKPYRITFGYLAGETAGTGTAYLLINDDYYTTSEKLANTEASWPSFLIDPEATGSSVIEKLFKKPELVNQIRIGYTVCPVGTESSSEAFKEFYLSPSWRNLQEIPNIGQQFYGRIYDLRLYPIGFEELNLRLLNRGTMYELYSYAPSSYKLAYAIYQDLNILKSVAMSAEDWSVRKVRVFHRQVWDSILTDMYPVSLMEQSQSTWQYTADYYDPADDANIHIKKRTIALDLSQQQLKTLMDTPVLADRTALLQSWHLSVPASTTAKYISEYVYCIDQALKKNAEVINSSSPLGYPDDDGTVKLTYQGNQYTIGSSDTVSIITTTLYPVKYSRWPYISFNPEENKTPSLTLDPVTGGISSDLGREFYLPTSVVSVDDHIEYTADLDINFKVHPTFSATTAYSIGNNIKYQYNIGLGGVTATLQTTEAGKSSSDLNHILMGMAVPRQKNISSENLGSFRRFFLKNFTLNSAFKHFLKATSYYTELYVPIPVTGANGIQFASRWHGLRYLREGSYYLTCKYPVQIMPFLDQDYEALASHQQLVTSYMTVRFKVEVKGTPVTYDNQLYGLPAADVLMADAATYKKYSEKSLKWTLSDPQKLFSPSDNRTFPHRVMTVNLFVQDLSSEATLTDLENPDQYSWKLLASNDPDLTSKVLALTSDLLEGNQDLVIKESIPAFLQKNYVLPFFIAGTDGPSSPVADSLTYKIDPMGNSASIESLTVKADADYNYLQLIAGKAYKVLFDYTGRLTELSFSDNKQYSSEILESDQETAAAPVKLKTLALSQINKVLQQQSLSTESQEYPRLVNLLLGTSILNTNVNSREYSYQSLGQSFSNFDDLRLNQSGFRTADGQFVAPTQQSAANSDNPGIYILGDPYACTRDQNALLRYPVNTTTARADLCQSYVITYLLENYPDGKDGIYPVKLLDRLPQLTYAKETTSNTLTGLGITDQSFSETTILTNQHKVQESLWNQCFSQLTGNTVGLISQISEFIPEFVYPAAVQNYAEYSYIKSTNEQLLGYSAKARNISVSAIPYQITKSSLYTSNLFQVRNLLDQQYWNVGYQVVNAPNGSIFGQTRESVDDLIWKKEVPKFNLNIGNAGEVSSLSGVKFQVSYTPQGSKTISSPVELYLAIKPQKVTSSAAEITGLTVKANLTRSGKVLQEVTLTKETAEVNGYQAYKWAGLPTVAFDSLTFIIEFPSISTSALQAISLQVGKVSIRKYIKDWKQNVGLSDALSQASAGNEDKNVKLSPHMVVLFKNQYNSLIITPLQFYTQSKNLQIIDGTAISRAVEAGTVSATAFIERWWLRKLGPYSPYTLLVKPWVRKIILTHQYIDLSSADLLGTAYQGDTEPIRCSSTSADVHKFVLNIDAYGVRSLYDAGSVQDLYEFKQSTSGDGVTYIDSTIQEVTTPFFKLQSSVDASGNKSGLFLVKTNNSAALDSYLLSFNTNLEIDTTITGDNESQQSRYAKPESGVIEDNYGTFSISNETISLLTSTFNVQDFSDQTNQNSLESSPVLVTNVQLLGQSSQLTPQSSSKKLSLTDVVLYEYEFLPIIYDEKTQHLSLNYFLHYPDVSKAKAQDSSQDSQP